MRISSWVVSGVLLLASRSAEAQGLDETEAEALFQKGRHLLVDGRFDAACNRFSESQRMDSSVGALLNLAECQERSGRPSAAWAGWLEAARAAQAAEQPAREAFARQRAAALRGKLGTLSIEVPETTRVHAISVMRDGVALGPSEWGSETPIDAGQHSVLAAAPGRISWARDVVIPVGTHVTLRIPELVRDDQRGAEPSQSRALASAGRAGTTASAVAARSAAPGWPTWIGVCVAAAAMVLLLFSLRRRRHARPGESSGEASVALSSPRVTSPPRRTLGVGISVLVVGVASLIWWKFNPRVVDTASVPEPPKARARSLQALRVAGDPWSGYSTFRRNPRLTAELQRHGIELEYLDDPTLYEQGARMRALADGRIDLALTTVDAFLQHGAKHTNKEEYPGVILWNIDESNGGDAIFLAKGRTGFDSVVATDKVCYATGTPSEHLWDFASLSFKNLGERLATDNGVVASDCWQKLLAGSVQIAVLWQPSTAIAEKAGYPLVFATGGQADDVIVDVLVANRDVLQRQGEKLAVLARAYFDLIDYYAGHSEDHAEFISKDCGTDCAADAELGRAVLKGIDFLTYQQNMCLWWGHCGQPSKMADTVRMTARRLEAKGKLDAGKAPEPQSILDDRVLLRVRDDPESKAARALLGAASGAARTDPRTERVYSYSVASSRRAADAEVGTLRLPNIYFAEARAELDQNARSVVGVIAEQLRAFPALCVRVSGYTNSAGDARANQRLSELRAQAIARYLTMLDPKRFPTNRFEALGLGASAPILRDDGEDLDASRRTEFLLFRCDGS